MITIRSKGNFEKTDRFFKRMLRGEILKELEKYGDEGVKALADATPKDSGKTAASWDYKVEKTRGAYSIVWTNSNSNDGVPIAVILQYGHGTRNGGYVEGRDYINPAIRPVFDKIADNAWKEVIRE